MMTRVSILIVIGLVSGAACSGNSRDTVPEPVTLQGQVRLAGSDPNVMVMLQPEGSGPEVQLIGEHLVELERLAGVTIAVEGSMMTSPRRTVDVHSYRILSVNGQQPTVGILVSRNGTLWLEGDTTLQLTSVPEGLRNQVGAKVWIVGRVTDGSLYPESYGIIRDP
jgi:hypothetical protein